MQPGLSRKLLAGIPRIDKDLSITVVDSYGNTLHTISPAALAGGGFGYVYERLVGLQYESQGFCVEYRSRLGYHDRGVDLIADRSDCRIFVQCKCSFVPFSPGKIETLLAKASSFVKANLTEHSNQFVLVVPSLELAFPKRKSKGGKSPAPNRAHHAFLKYNSLQSDVRLEVVEVPVSVPGLTHVADACLSIDTDPQQQAVASPLMLVVRSFSR